MSDEWPFQSDWEQRRAEPMPEFGIDWTVPSPLAIDRMPELKREERQLFERKERNEKVH